MSDQSGRWRQAPGPGPGPVGDGEEFPPLREDDVTAGDRLDDRVSEGEGLPDDDEPDRDA